MIKNKTIFITGGAGFIGASLSKRLVDDNKIIIYDNLARNVIKDSGIENHPNLTIIKGDILDFEHLKKSIPVKVDQVLHMAAIAGIDTVIRSPIQTMKVNMVGTYNVLEALRERGLINKVERFIYFSTSEVFGITAFRAEEKAPTRLQPVGEARWSYAVSKLAGEHLTFSYHKELGLKAVTLRPFNVYGSGQVGEGAIHHFVVRAIRGEPLTIHGEGDQIRSWCYIDDMVDGILLAMSKEEAIGEVFNIGNPKGTVTILELAKKIIRLANSKSTIVHTPRSYVDVELRIPSIEKAQRILGYQPKVDLDEGIKRTIEWYRKKAEVRVG